MQGVWESVDHAKKYLAPGDRIEFWFPVAVDETFADISVSARAVIVCEDSDPSPPEEPADDDEVVVDSGGDPAVAPSLDGYTWAIQRGTTIDVVSLNVNRGGALVTTESGVVALAIITGGRVSYQSVGSIISSPTGLAFTQKGAIQYTTENGLTFMNMELWTAPSSAALSGENFTVTLVDAADNIAMGVVGIKDVTAQGDPSAAAPISDSAGPSTIPTYPEITMSLTGNSDFIFFIGGGVGMNKNGLWPTGFTSIIPSIFCAKPFAGNINLGMSYKRLTGGMASTAIAPHTAFRGEGVCMAFPFQGT